MQKRIKRQYGQSRMARIFILYQWLDIISYRNINTYTIFSVSISVFLTAYMYNVLIRLQYNNVTKCLKQHIASTFA